MVKYKEGDIAKMKRPELEKIVNDNNLGIEIKVGMSNKELIKAIVEKLSEANLMSETISFEGKTKLELTTLLEERALEREQLIALVTANSLDLLVDELDDDELAEAILKILDSEDSELSDTNGGDNGDGKEQTKEVTKPASKAVKPTKEEFIEQTVDEILGKEITPTQRAYARKLCADHKVSEVFVNPTRNEYFTQKCNAINSVGGDATKIVTVKIN